MNARPVRMLWMMLAGWRSSPPEGTWRTPKAPSVSRLMGWMNKFMLPAHPAEGFSGGPAGEWHSETGRRQRLVGVRDPGGKRRLLFGAGKGPAEAVARTKQESTEARRRQSFKKFVSEQWILSCKSLGRPLVYQV